MSTEQKITIYVSGIMDTKSFSKNTRVYLQKNDLSQTKLITHTTN